MKYILVTGGVISGVGKGIIASSLGVLLQSIGVRVSAIKIDPYINIDAGTFSPYEHGEVYVLDDGGEVDLDLGNYERFLGVRMTKDNNITTGKIYLDVIKRERRGDYLGKTVQVVPHITDYIQDWVERVAKKPVDGSGKEPEVCIIELGGTTGDYEGMPFFEAFRQFQFRVKRENFINVHVSLVPKLKATGEQKTKPTQNSVKELRMLGVPPDLVVCRSSSPVERAVKEKISLFCQVAPEEVISVHDTTNVYHVPLVLVEQNVVPFLTKRLNITAKRHAEKGHLPTELLKWQELAKRYDRAENDVKIALVGKYVKLEDSYASVVKALYHAALACDRRLVLNCINAEDLEEATHATNPEQHFEAWQQLSSADGVIVPGGFGDRGIEGMIRACHWARTRQKPFLGVCLGMQCAVIEFCRAVVGWKDAHSAEFEKNTNYSVIIEMPEHHTENMGGTMRLGSRKTVFKEDCKSVVRKLYNNVSDIDERHRHRYEVNPLHINEIEKHGLIFVGHGHDVDKQRMEICELTDHPYYVGVQFHPEYLSLPLKPSPPFLGLILAATKQLDGYLQGTRLSPLSFLKMRNASSSSLSSFSSSASLFNGETAARENGGAA